VVRFNRTARLVHAVQALSFLILLFTGLAISLSWMEALVGNRELMRQIHLTSAFFFVFGPALVALAGDRISIKADIVEVETWTADDIRWLKSPRVEPASWTPPAGRYNAGQKLNAIFTVYCTLAFGVTGLILWQNRRFPFSLVSEANTVHQWLAYIALFVFLGHLYLSVVHPATRASLRGIIQGTVPAAWAREHHPRWQAPASPERPPVLGEIARATTSLVLGLYAAALFTRWGLEWLGANATDAVVKLIYQVTALPGTAGNSTAAHVFDLGAVVWCGLVVALLYGTMRRYALLPRVLPSPSKG
jgi:formate dehydrogenase subunit gamma